MCSWSWIGHHFRFREFICIEGSTIWLDKHQTNSVSWGKLKKRHHCTKWCAWVLDLLLFGITLDLSFLNFVASFFYVLSVCETCKPCQCTWHQICKLERMSIVFQSFMHTNLKDLYNLCHLCWLLHSPLYALLLNMLNSTWCLVMFTIVMWGLYYLYLVLNMLNPIALKLESKAAVWHFHIYLCDVGPWAGIHKPGIDCTRPNY